MDFLGLTADALVATGLVKLGYEYVNIGMLKSNNSVYIVYWEFLLGVFHIITNHKFQFLAD